MTISTSSFTKSRHRNPAGWWVCLFGLGLLLSVTACRETSPAQPRSALLATLQANFGLAMQGDDALQGAPKQKTRMAEMPQINAAGIACNPARLTAGAPGLRIDLPARASQHRVFLAAIVPNGSSRIIYISYGEDVESIDLIIPSKTIDWQNARKRRRFDVDAKTFDALVPGEDKPRPLFEEAGIYQLALISNDASEHQNASERRHQVLAGCVVHWQP
jgi:acyl transferase domain-containing protein